MIFYILTLTTGVSWIGLILSQSNLFTLPKLLLSLLLFMLMIRPSIRTQIPKPVFTTRLLGNSIAFLILLAICAFLYARPHEYVTGRWDPGTYMNIGFHIAHQGGLEIEDPLFKEMSAKEIELFVRLQPGAIRYPGFYIKEPYLGTLVPQFYHVYPVWIAIFLKIFGPYGSLFVNPLFALLSLWTLWKLVQKIFNPRMALMACAFLGLSLPQIWNARFPTSEILAQYFILSGIYSLALFEKDQKNIFGIFAGCAFGIALLTRPTAILLIPCLIVYLACRNWVRFQKRDFYILLPLGVALLHLAIQNQIWTKYYVHTLPAFFNHREKLFYGILAACFGLICILTALFRKKIQSLLSKKWILRLGGLTLSMFILGLGIYAYWIRPHLGRSQELFNLVHLSWFLGWTLVLGILGAALWGYRGLHKINLFLFILAIAETIFFIDKKRTFSSYPWALKRYTPVIVPALSIFAAYFLNWLRNLLPMGKNFVIYVLCIVSILSSWIQGFRFITHTDQRGMIPFLTHLNKKMNPDGIYLFDRDWIALPLQHLFQKNVFVLPELGKFSKMEPVLLRWIRNGKKIYYVGSKEHPYSLKLDFKKIPLELENLKSSLIESSFGTYPNKVKKIILQPVLYQVQELKTNEIENKNEFFINIGHNNIGLLEGFDKVRRFLDSDKTYRWTQKSSSIELKEPLSSQNLILKLRIKNSKPVMLGPSPVHLKINQKRVGSLLIPAQTGLKTYVIKVPQEKTGDPFIRKIVLESETWNPKKSGVSQDDRDLGVVLDWIKILTGSERLIQWIDIGHQKNSFIQGFYSPETNPEAFFWGRWTLGKAQIVLPYPLGNSEGELILRVDGFRKINPVKKEPPNKGFRKKKIKQDAVTKLTLSLDGKVLVKNLALQPKLQEIHLRIPKGFLKSPSHRVTLTLESNPWNPYQVGIKGFPSQLGVLLDWIKIRKIETS